jgi:D-glycero-D-manno-heptose 1,7-bisphosphate phosphatase
MLDDAARELGLDIGQSLMIGDKPSDLEAGRAAGCRYVVRLGSDEDGVASARCDDWHQVRTFIASTAEPG